MTILTVRLVYPPNLIDVPIIYNLIRQYDLTVNIIGAQITEESGWLEMQVTGSEAVIQDAFSWLTSQGIELHIRKN